MLVQPDAGAILPGSVVPSDTRAGQRSGRSRAPSRCPPRRGDIPDSLWTPPARMGMGPSLALSYSSRAGRSIAGVGWDLTGFGVSRIARCYKTIAQDGAAGPVAFDDSDAFCLDGQRLVPSGNPTEGGVVSYMLERDPFTKVLHNTTQGGFRVLTRDGSVSTYGSTLASQDWKVNSAGSLRRPTSWPRLRDGRPRRQPDGDRLDDARGRPRGHGSFECTEFLPDHISYTAGPSSPAQRSVQFHYEKGPDSRCKWVGGVGVGSQQRLKQVDVSGPTGNGTAILRSYVLDYAPGALTQRSRLTGVQTCDAGAAACMRATTFDYEEGSNAFEGLPNPLMAFAQAETCVQPGPGGVGYEGGGWTFADLNNDGKDDVFCSTGYALNDGNQFSRPTAWKRRIHAPFSLRGLMGPSSPRRVAGTNHRLPASGSQPAAHHRVFPGPPCLPSRGTRPPGKCGHRDQQRVRWAYRLHIKRNNGFGPTPSSSLTSTGTIKWTHRTRVMVSPPPSSLG